MDDDSSLTPGGALLRWRHEIFETDGFGRWYLNSRRGGSLTGPVATTSGGRCALRYETASFRAAGRAVFEWPVRSSVVFYDAFATPFRKGRVEIVPVPEGPVFEPDVEGVDRLGSARIGLAIFTNGTWLKVRREAAGWRSRRPNLVVMLEYGSGRRPIVIPAHRHLRLRAIAPARDLVLIRLVASSGQRIIEYEPDRGFRF
jgi:hypothetical protein